MAIASWTVIAFRVKRNKNLLANISKIPEKDRLKALESEMGSVRVPENMSPDQWLRSKVHQYYFWAFVLLAVLVALVVAIAYQGRIVEPVNAAVVKEVFTQALDTESTRKAAEDAQKALNQKIEDAQRAVNQKIDALNSLSLGVSREFVMSRLGVPFSRENFKWLEETPGQYAHFEILYFGNDLYDVVAVMYLDELHDYSVTFSNSDIHPIISGISKSAFGKFVFSDLDGRSSDPNVIGESIDASSTPWGYAELIDEDVNGQTPRISIGYTATGATYTTHETLNPNPLTLAIQRYGDEDGAEEAWSSAGSELDFHMTATWAKCVKSHVANTCPEIAYFRRNVYPNTYRVESETSWYVADKAPYPIADLGFRGVEEDRDPTSYAEYLYRNAINEKNCHPKCPVQSGD